jgi:hypothetical protein
VYDTIANDHLYSTLDSKYNGVGEIYYPAIQDIKTETETDGGYSSIGGSNGNCKTFTADAQPVADIETENLKNEARDIPDPLQSDEPEDYLTAVQYKY